MSAQQLEQDVLRQILIDAYNLQTHEPASLLQYLHRIHSVCRWWRDAVADISELWTHIIVSEPVFTADFLSRCLTYSRDRPLDLVFRFADSKSLVDALAELLPLLLPHRARWRSLAIHPLALTSDVDASPALPLIGEVPNLQYCVIEVNKDAGRDGDGAVHLMDLRGPNVEYLTVTQEAWLLLALPLRFPRVHSLNLKLVYEEDEDGIGLSSMLRCVAAFASLSRLLISGSNGPMPAWRHRQIQVSLPALTELIFDGQSLAGVVNPFLDSITAPHLRRLSVRPKRPTQYSSSDNLSNLLHALSAGYVSRRLPVLSELVLAEYDVGISFGRSAAVCALESIVLLDFGWTTETQAVLIIEGNGCSVSSHPARDLFVPALSIVRSGQSPIAARDRTLGYLFYHGIETAIRNSKSDKPLLKRLVLDGVSVSQKEMEYLADCIPDLSTSPVDQLPSFCVRSSPYDSDSEIYPPRPTGSD